MSPTTQQSSAGTKILLASVLILLVAGVGVYFLLSSSATTNQVAVDTPTSTEEDAASPTETTNTTEKAPASKTPTTPKEPAPAVVDNKKYKDGKYTAKGNYRTPAGNESVTITLTIKNDIITASDFSGTSLENTSQNYIDRFTQGYKKLVVGKSVDAVNLSVVSGSSLTPTGFMNALTNIKTQAKNS
jgi:uncharacterized protein with FMN-binding domain